jgi:hypothetical protein
MGNDEMPDPERVREFMQVISESLPGLLENLAKIMYGEKESIQFATAAANFYKTLKDAGMTNEQAFQLTREYMGNMSLGNIMKGMASSGG